MGKIEVRAVVDAGPIIHLDELSCLDLMSDFSRWATAPEVLQEVVCHRPRLRRKHLPTSWSLISAREHRPSPQLNSLIESLGLHAGERAALTLCERLGVNLLLTDDSAARLAGESLGLRVHGTVGILVRSIRRELRTRDQVLSLLQELPARST